MGWSSPRRSAGDRVVTLTPVGEIGLRTAGALRAAIADTLRAPRPVDVVVDLAGVTFLDGTGIGALVAGRDIAIRVDAATRWSTRSGRCAGSWTLPVSCGSSHPEGD
ncbi:STAS domain-containing protein [Nonomuraea sp. NPDC048892]|uniref:STAS domain-containing protein n=1 Tax=Nonomuraea sp. NPDC048892 TaxID=3154624 RepID=UPI0033E4AB75